MIPDITRKQKNTGTILVVIIGLILIIFFVLVLQPQNTGRYDNQPLFTLRNCDENKSHTISVSVKFANDTPLKESFTLSPRQYVYSTINTVETKQDLDFNFIIDTNQSAHIPIHGVPRVTTIFDVCDSEKNGPVSVVEFII
jgi:hypothetical protein